MDCKKEQETSLQSCQPSRISRDSSGIWHLVPASRRGLIMSRNFDPATPSARGEIHIHTIGRGKHEPTLQNYGIPFVSKLACEIAVYARFTSHEYLGAVYARKRRISARKTCFTRENWHRLARTFLSPF